MPFSKHGHGSPSRSAVILGVLALVVAGALSAGMVIGAFAYSRYVTERAGDTAVSALANDPSAAATLTALPETATSPATELPGQPGEGEAQSDSADEPEASIAVVEATVVRVVDGDTAVFRLEGGATEKTRFIGIDTPESTNSIERYGQEAAAYTKDALSPGDTVFLERDVEERDRYGRLLAYVWLERPTRVDESAIRLYMLNARLALDGYAKQMTIQPNSKYAGYFREFVGEARAEEAGLWGVEPDSDSKASAGTDAVSSAAAYIGNRNTKKFHEPSCSSVGQMNPENKVPLSSRDQAIAGGFVPCGNCRP